jgi:DNA repair protein SbcC/Rad50
MTVNISQLRDRIALRYPDIEQVDDWVIRFTKKTGNEPYAVYYFDAAPNLPETQEELTKYQDRVIGSHYFENKKSLQWNNYLYFVTSRDRLADEKIIYVKDIIERDRTYARKFVIPEEEIDSVLIPPVIESAQAFPHESILSIWTQKLIESGLDQAILSNDDLPTRLRLIENSKIGTAITQNIIRKLETNHKEPFIRSLVLNTYRDFPTRRNFEFGTVNLIFGANGSGKTSLLEAIELYYCGKTKRNPNTSHTYDFTVVKTDDQSETVNNNRELQIFRDRNLVWYGQSEVRTNNLYQSFSQFNFLNTDAAVDLINSSERIEEDLSKLLVGPAASEAWRNIERVNEEIKKNLNGLRPLKIQIEEDLASIDIQIKAISNVPEESDSIHVRLNEMISRLGWHELSGKKDEIAVNLLAPLSELISLAQQAMQIDWATSPITQEGLATYCYKTKLMCENTETSFAKLDQLQKEESGFIDAMNRDQEAFDLINQVNRCIEANLLKYSAEHKEQQAIVAKFSGWLSGLDSNIFELLSECHQNTLVLGLQQVAISNRLNTEALLANTKIEYENFRKLRDESLNLAQQLREIAAKILQTSSKPDECPLCHTTFENGELAKNINMGFQGDIERIGQALLSKLREHEAALHKTNAIEVASDWIVRFSERSSLATQNLSISSVLLEVKNIKGNLEIAQRRLDWLNQEMRTLEQQGVSMKNLEVISIRLGVLGYPLKTYSKEEAMQLISILDKNKSDSLQALTACRQKIDELKMMLGGILGTNERTYDSLKGVFSQLRERIAKTESIRTKLSHFSSSFPWPDKLPLSELIVEAESIRKVASDLQTAISRENQAKIAYAESSKRKKELDQKLTDLCPRLSQFSTARDTLEKLRRDHSLTKAMETALQENRSGIEMVFSQIHTPAEFSGLGKSWKTLKRKSGEQEAKLTEISTGQRAAFALSIFLAQNAQLKTAPPLILIDDPIAHIDDMNALSFLDYLREVVLNGQRQIFFATANDKLAALFERKFDFLGPDEFRRFNLTRHS